MALICIDDILQRNFDMKFNKKQKNVCFKDARILTMQQRWPRKII